MDDWRADNQETREAGMDDQRKQATEQEEGSKEALAKPASGIFHERFLMVEMNVDLDRPRVFQLRNCSQMLNKR